MPIINDKRDQFDQSFIYQTGLHFKDLESEVEFFINTNQIKFFK